MMFPRDGGRRRSDCLCFGPDASGEESGQDGLMSPVSAPKEEGGPGSLRDTDLCWESLCSLEKTA